MQRTDATSWVETKGHGIHLSGGQYMAMNESCLVSSWTTAEWNPVKVHTFKDTSQQWSKNHKNISHICKRKDLCNETSHLLILIYWRDSCDQKRHTRNSVKLSYLSGWSLCMQRKDVASWLAMMPWGRKGADMLSCCGQKKQTFRAIKASTDLPENIFAFGQGGRGLDILVEVLIFWKCKPDKARWFTGSTSTGRRLPMRSTSKQTYFVWSPTWISHVQPG